MSVIDTCRFKEILVKIERVLVGQQCSHSMSVAMKNNYMEGSGSATIK